MESYFCHSGVTDPFLMCVMFSDVTYVMVSTSFSFYGLDKFKVVIIV